MRLYDIVVLLTPDLSEDEAGKVIGDYRKIHATPTTITSRSTRPRPSSRRPNAGSNCPTRSFDTWRCWPMTS